MEGTWLDDDHWICTRHARAVVLPASAARCWYVGCSVRPPRPGKADASPGDAERQPSRVSPQARRHAEKLARGLPTVLSQRVRRQEAAAQGADQGARRCALPGCDNPARPRSKYCSRACSNRNARARYAARHKGERAA